MENTISIHAPARGATCGVQAQVKRRTDFNPRSREGSDVDLADCCQIIFISIHAPARGATCAGVFTRAGNRDFNPRSREGSDFRLSLSLWAQVISIHAPARGATPLPATSSQLGIFQSTLPRGERLHLLTFFRLQYGYILFHLTNKYSFCF